MRIAIYGAGAMGTVLGAYLSKAGKSIDLISRNESHILGLKKNGAHIIGKVDFVQPVTALLPSEMNGQYDLIFLMTKQLDNRNIVKNLIPFLTDDGVICTMQNGLPELSVSEIIGPSRTYGCAVSWGATMVGNGIVELTSEPSRKTLTFSLGRFEGERDAKFEAIHDLLDLMGDVECHANFMGARWAKLLVNSAFSGLSAITGGTFGEIAHHRLTRLIGQKIMKECIDLSRKCNIKIEPIQGKDVVKLLDYHHRLKQKISFMIIPIAMRKHRSLQSSMLQDLLAGKKCEIEAINGVVCAYGDKVDFETPYNDMIIKIVHAMETQQLKPGWDHLKHFDELLNHHS
jgi:2-dehydropantoate 2-reductase